MVYVDNNTGRFFTAEEIKKLYEQFCCELKKHFETFDEYIEEMKKKGNLKEVDQDDIEELLAGELDEMIAQGWTDKEAKENKEAFFDRIGDYTEVLTEADIWRVWDNVLETR